MVIGLIYQCGLHCNVRRCERHHITDINVYNCLRKSFAMYTYQTKTIPLCVSQKSSWRFQKSIDILKYITMNRLFAIHNHIPLKFYITPSTVSTTWIQLEWIIDLNRKLIVFSYWLRLSALFSGIFMGQKFYYLFSFQWCPWICHQRLKIIQMKIKCKRNCHRKERRIRRRH